MRELRDYNEHDCEEIIHQAKLIAMMAIHSAYDDLMDEESVCLDTMAKVKKAIETLYYIEHIK